MRVLSVEMKAHLRRLGDRYVFRAEATDKKLRCIVAGCGQVLRQIAPSDVYLSISTEGTKPRLY
jgi:hypothetical protein